MAASRGGATGILGQRYTPGAASDSACVLEFGRAEAGLSCTGKVWGGVRTWGWAEVDPEERFDEPPVCVFPVYLY